MESFNPLVILTNNFRERVCKKEARRNRYLCKLDNRIGLPLLPHMPGGTSSEDLAGNGEFDLDIIFSSPEDG